MNASARNELNSIITELNSIIKELESISSGVRKDFVGIGNEHCANCIDRVLDNYYTARTKLNNMDTTTIRKGFQPAGGGGHSF